MSTNQANTPTILEELVAKEEKLKSQKTLIGLLIGVMIGLAIWAATHDGGFVLTVILLAGSFLIGKKYTQNLERIRAEISSKA